MAVTVRDEWLPRSIMFLCLGAGLLVLIVQWSARAINPKAAKPPKPQESAPQPVKVATVFPIAVSVPKVAPTVTAPLPNLRGVAQPKLVVDLSDRAVYLYKQQQVQTSYPIAIGKDGWETPKGTFQVEAKRVNPTWVHPITRTATPAGPDNPLGSRWIGFWSDATTEIGFHGTNQEELIGLAVSHGCLRMRNQDVEALYEQVKLGTPVVVRP